MTAKKRKLLLSFICIAVAATIYILFINWSYITSGRPNGFKIDKTQIEMLNWGFADGVYNSKNDPGIMISALDGYVSSIEVECVVTGVPLAPVVFFNTERGESFSQENSFIPEFEYSDGKLKMGIGRSVYDLRIDLVEDEGLSLSLGTITAYKNAFLIRFPFLLITLLSVFILLTPLYIPASEMKLLPVYLAGFKKYGYLLQNLVKKDITTKYRRSVLGIAWSVLNPLLMMLVITAVFQKLFRFQVENFPLYYLTGSLIFNFVSESTNGAMSSVLNSGALIRKVYIPKYIFPVEKCLFSLVNMLFSTIAVILMFFALGVPPPVTILLFPIPIFYTFLFCVGFGMILATMNVFFRDVSHLYGVWITAWMYLTPIIYPESILPAVVMRFVEMNPLYYYVDYFRQVVLYGTLPNIESNLMCIFFSVFFFVTGVAVFKRNQVRFILFI